MKLKRALQIKEIWDRIEAEDPDISTESLIERTRMELGHSDNCAVTNALSVLHDHEQAQKGKKS